ncbi:MAG: NAD(P)/FAD-dependent oxidoreductase [Actinophytocola sp.]|nr:NAD(P)/FAD-dependent oxidoreductase [Actinophytocola sp.]
MPSKTLIEAAAVDIAFAAAAQRVRDAVAAVAAAEDAAALAEEGITVEHGQARIVARDKVDVGGRVFCTSRLVVTVGSRPAAPPIPGLAELGYLTTDTVFDLTELPGSLLVLGGGAVGCELAQAFAAFGATVTVVEAAPRLLPDEDPDASAVVAHVFAQQGIAVYVAATVVEATHEHGRPALRLADETVLTGDRLLVATGRKPSTDQLGLGSVGVQLDGRGFVVVDDHMATTAGGIYAAGDVVGRLNLTHAADEMARVAATNALPRRNHASFDGSTVPRVVFTDPEVAQVGMTEDEAAARDGTVLYLPMTDVDRAITAGRTEGFVKLITGKATLTGGIGGGRVLGATIVAPRAGEMIHEPTLAMRTRMFAGRLAQATHAYPTWSHALQLAAAQQFGYGHRRPYPAGTHGRTD